mgnify:CR=1 FL=1
MKLIGIVVYLQNQKIMLNMCLKMVLNWITLPLEKVLVDSVDMEA